MLTPFTRHPVGVRCQDLRQRIATRCFERMMEQLRKKASVEQLEDKVVVRAMEILADQLRIFGRPDLSDRLEDAYHGAVQTTSR